MSKYLILCIDDDIPGLTLRALMLQSRGYSVLTASSGPEGLQVLRSNPDVRLLILDYSMPQMHGGEVAVEVRKFRPELPVLLLSAYFSIPEETLAITNAFVTKGEGPVVLFSKVEELLELRSNSVPA